MEQEKLPGIGLILITILGYILHFGFGAIARMEKVLEDAAAGNYSLRLYLRNKDILRPLAKKMNKVIDLLEKKSDEPKQ